MADLIKIVQFRVARRIDEKTFSEASDAVQLFFIPGKGVLLAGS